MFAEFNLAINIDEFSERYLKYLGEGSFLIDGALELCNYLLKKNYRIVIITNGIKEVQLKRIQRSELKNFIETIIVSEDAGYQKPNSEIFEYAFKKINFKDRERSIIIGDSLTSDIQGGINFGIDTCWFNPSGKKNELSIEPKYEIQELKHIEGIL